MIPASSTLISDIPIFFKLISKYAQRLRFFYKPVTLSVLGVALAILAYVATTQDVLEEGRDKRRVYVVKNVLSQMNSCMTLSLVVHMPL